MTQLPAAPAPAPAPLPDVQPMAPAKRNVLAIVALVVSVVGFVFACMPGALIVGWILLPIGFVLSIVALFLKGRGKWMAVVALVASIVGTIVGVVVFTTVVANSFNEAFGEPDVTVSEPDIDSVADPAVSAEPAGETEEAAAQGTRDNPFPLGSTITTDDWTVVINSYTLDGAAAVAAGNSFNDPAPAGSHYEIVNATVTYTGAESGYAAEVGVALVTSSGNVVNSFDNIVVLADGFGLDELYAGASTTGSIAFLVPDGETATIRVSPGFFADEVFVQ